MVPLGTPLAAGVEAYLDQHERKSLLRFITCGSVDDGKSTLIGRLLYESKLVYEDQLAALAVDSQRVGTQGADLDLALLVDGLAAEREQGITIDVAYRFFSTDRRKFIVADTPGHEQYTRNMVTGASTADLAVVMIDASKGVLTQTRRHSFLVSLLGIRHVVLAVNKLDLVDFSEDVFDRITADYVTFSADLGFDEITAIPLSALRGDNVVQASPNTPWYAGPSLLEHLETVAIDDDHAAKPFRMPVQLVSRPSSDFRGFAGQIASGSLHPGDRVRVLPGGQTSTVDRIVTFDGDLPEAVAGQSVTVTLTDEIDVSRGAVLGAADDAPAMSDQFEAHIVWMAESEMLPGRQYLMKLGTSIVGATPGTPKYRVNINTMEHVAARTLSLNEIGVCNLVLDRSVPFDPYRDCREMGGFVLIDRLTNATVGAGLLNFALRRADNVHWQPVEVDAAARANVKGHNSAVIWLTGLSGAGKSTIANLVEGKLLQRGRHTYLLDGDNVRHGLNKDLGFTDADRVENIRRVTEMAALMADAGLIVLVSFISPFRAERRSARQRIPDGKFFEVFVDTPLDVAEARDVKGLYRKARDGQLQNFTGIDSPYEAPENPELRIDTTVYSPDEAAEQIVAMVENATRIT